MKAFTLVELMVVISIIVVLLALLAPGLDKAIYQAELTVCGANLKGVGNASILYAMDHKRHYFFREAALDPRVPNYQARYLTVPGDATWQQSVPKGYDDRPVMRPYLPIKTLSCPLVDDVHLDEALPTTFVVSSYVLWMGWKYNKAYDGDPTNSGTGMLKLGQRINFNSKAYDTLAGDTVIGFLFNIASSHPDDKNVLSLQSNEPKTDPPPANATDSEKYTVSQYFGSMWAAPGLYDLNFVRDDASVTRINKTDWGNGETWWGADLEPRMDVLPMNKDADNGWGQVSVPRGR